MSASGHLSLGLPKPGPVLKATLVTVGFLGILNALLMHWGPGAQAFRALVCTLDGVRGFELWRLVTSGLLTHPRSLNHLLFSLLGLYFLSPELERRWGSARFLRFLLLSIVVGNLFVLGVAVAAGEGAPPMFRPDAVFGPGAIIAAIAVAWARELPTAQIRLFFFLPVSGRSLLWITLGFAALGVVYATDIPEGMAAPFGGIVAGLLFSGSPSAVRSLYLKMRLANLERQSQTLKRPSDGRPSGATRRGGTPAPPLRIVYGGLEEELKKRKPPKDKRYLN